MRKTKNQVISVNPFLFHKIIEESVSLGVVITLVHLGKLSPYLKKTEAAKHVGRYRLQQWIDQGLIDIRTDGNHSAAWRVDRIELEILYISYRLTTCV